jgi:lipoate-protein ligase B
MMKRRDMMRDLCQIQWLGQIEYSQALGLQKELVAKRTAGEIPDMLLLLEHPPTYTLGVDGHREHLLISDLEMARLNIAYHTVDRGGSIMYHSPGQLVIYPIIQLHQNFYHDYIKMLESVIIRTLSFFKLRGFRQPGQRGVWVLSPQGDMAKIGNMGVKINLQHIASHGFSINVNPNLQLFDLIVPGGVKDCYVTSLQHLLNRPVDVSAVIEPVVQSFCQIFELEPLSLETPVTAQNFSWSTPL